MTASCNQCVEFRVAQRVPVPCVLVCDTGMNECDALQATRNDAQHSAAQRAHAAHARHTLHTVHTLTLSVVHSRAVFLSRSSLVSSCVRLMSSASLSKSGASTSQACVSHTSRMSFRRRHHWVHLLPILWWDLVQLLQLVSFLSLPLCLICLSLSSLFPPGLLPPSPSSAVVSQSSVIAGFSTGKQLGKRVKGKAKKKEGTSSAVEGEVGSVHVKQELVGESATGSGKRRRIRLQSALICGICKFVKICGVACGFGAHGRKSLAERISKTPQISLIFFRINSAKFPSPGLSWGHRQRGLHTEGSQRGLRQSLPWIGHEQRSTHAAVDGSVTSLPFWSTSWGWDSGQERFTTDYTRFAGTSPVSPCLVRSPSRQSTSTCLTTWQKNCTPEPGLP